MANFNGSSILEISTFPLFIPHGWLAFLENFIVERISNFAEPITILFVSINLVCALVGSGLFLRRRMSRKPHDNWDFSTLRQQFDLLYFEHIHEAIIRVALMIFYVLKANAPLRQNTNRTHRWNCTDRNFIVKMLKVPKNTLFQLNLERTLLRSGARSEQTKSVITKSQVIRHYDRTYKTKYNGDKNLAVGLS